MPFPIHHFPKLSKLPHKQILIVAVPVLLFLILAGTGLINFYGIKKSFSPKTSEIQKDADNFIEGNDANDIALKKAQEWQSDAELSYISSDNLSENSRGDNWTLIYVSVSKPGLGYEISVVNRVVVSWKEIEYSGRGAELPEEGISQRQAVQTVKNMDAYKDAEIYGVEAIYGPAGKVWYWGVKTSKGTVSIRAK